MKTTFLALSVALIICLLGCDADSNESDISTTGELQFGISISNDVISSKSLSLSKNIDAIYISIKKDGEHIEGYNYTRLELIKLLGDYTTREIELGVGSYTVTDFMVVDPDDSVLYLTPKQGSKLAMYVDYPLPYEFTISENDSARVSLQVLDVNAGTVAEDFGYVAFGFEIISTDTVSDEQTVSDVDGNIYSIVGLGSQIWMGENLRTTKYNDNTDIAIVSNNEDWSLIAPNGSGTSQAAMCYYTLGTEVENESFGAYYNWFAVSQETNGGKEICPEGWHVPSDSEWIELEAFLGTAQSGLGQNGLHEGNVGSQLAASSTLWKDGDLKLDEDYGVSNFRALPGGTRSDWDGTFSYVGEHAEFWTSTDQEFAYHRGIRYGNAGVYRFNSVKGIGMSVRCLKNQ